MRKEAARTGQTEYSELKEVRGTREDRSPKAQPKTSQLLKEVDKMDRGERQRDLQRVEKLRELNKDPKWVNSDLYRGCLYRRGLYTSAYELKGKPGNIISGSDSETVDGNSLDEIDEIIRSLKDESYQPKPSRWVYIPQANGQMRKLGIPSPRDKILLEVARMVLEAIYEPIFSNASHGFRVGRSPHTALKEIQGMWSGTNWFIAGDVRSCFDEVNHEILISIIKEKINDERFLNLIRKFLKCGYVEKEMETRNSVIGISQGEVLAPMLANIYLHKLDMYMSSLQEGYEQGQRKRANPKYKALAGQKGRLVAQGETRTKEFRAIVREMRKLPSLDPYDSNFIRIRYIRYTDDWIIGVSGSKELAKEVEERVKTFLKDELKLHLSEEKTKITNARSEQALFLGVKISTGRMAAEQKVKLSTNASGRHVKRRSTGWEVVMKAPIDQQIKRLAEKNFCDAEGKPKAKGAWVNLDADQIIQRYSSINRGIQNYYRFTDNFVEIRRIQYVLKYSLAKTLAEKYKTSVARVFDKGKIKTKVIGADGAREVQFYQNRSWKVNRNGFKPSRNIDQIVLGTKLGTRSKLGQKCAVCGDDSDVEMHHVRHLRKMNQRWKDDQSFKRVMIALNRKQIPLCSSCHHRVHAGVYDGIRLRDLVRPLK
jgi:group II intron reverse transcriptase/maturase